MRHLVLLLSFFLFSTDAFSQFGLKAGLTHSFISLGSEEIGFSSHETEFNPGLTAGAFGKLWLSDVIFLTFSKISPSKSMACAYGTINALSISGFNNIGKRWVMFSFFGGGSPPANFQKTNAFP